MVAIEEEAGFFISKLKYPCLVVTCIRNCVFLAIFIMFYRLCLRFLIALENLSFTWRRQHCRWRVANSYYTPANESSGGYIGITLSALCLSVCADSCLATNVFFDWHWHTIYMVHGCITMRQNVAHIHDPDTTLTFDIKVKYRVLTCFLVRPLTTFWFDTGTWVYHHERMCGVYS